MASEDLLQRVIRSIDANVEAFEQNVAVLDRLARKVEAQTIQIESNTAETRAQTQAIFRMLDERGGAEPGG